MSNLFARFRYKKNKIFAVGLASIATALLTASFIIQGFQLGWLNFLTNVRALWNYVFYFIIYLILLVTNINNDNFAYSGILMFVFWQVFDQIYSILYQQANIINSAQSGNVVGTILVVLFYLFLIGEAGCGITLYIFTRRYAAGRCAFWIVRMLAIIYSACLATSLGISIATNVIANSGSAISAITWIRTFLIPVSEVVMSGAVVFTLERLRRI